MMNKRVVTFSVFWCLFGVADSSAATVASRLSAGAHKAGQFLTQAAAKGAKSAAQAVKKDPLSAVGVTSIGIAGGGGAVAYHDYQVAKAEKARKYKEWEDKNVLTGNAYQLFLNNNELRFVQKQSKNQQKELEKELEKERAQWFFMRAARNFFPTINQTYYDLTMALTAAKKAIVARAIAVKNVTIAKVSAAAAALEYALNPSGMAYDVGKKAWNMSAQKATRIGTAVGNKLSRK